MAYDRINWKNLQTELSAENFNHMDEGIKENSDSIDKLLKLIDIDENGKTILKTKKEDGSYDVILLEDIINAIYGN